MRLVLLMMTCAAAFGADVQDVAWMEGRWRGQIWDGVVEEVWTGPLSGGMVGAFRFVKGGKLVFSEMVHVEKEGDDLYMRLKHFNPGLKGWEEKNDNVSLKLTEAAPNRATFKMVDGDKTMELRLRNPAPDKLEILLVRTNAKGTKEDLFAYTRLP